MGVDRFGSPGIDQTIRSLRALLKSFEREISFVANRASAGSGDAMQDFARTVAGGFVGAMSGRAFARALGDGTSAGWSSLTLSMIYRIEA